MTFSGCGSYHKDTCYYHESIARVIAPVCGQLQSADNKQKLYLSTIKRS